MRIHNKLIYLVCFLSFDSCKSLKGNYIEGKWSNVQGSGVERDRQKRLQDIYSSISGNWIYKDLVDDGSQVQKKYKLIITSNQIKIFISYNVFSSYNDDREAWSGSSQIGSTKEKGITEYTITYEIEDVNNISTSDFATYNLKTKGKDGTESYKIVYDYGRFKALYFHTLSSNWLQLSRE